jgi:hypothetical protein
MKWKKRMSINFDLETHIGELVGIAYVPYKAEVEVTVDSDLEDGKTREWISNVEIIEVNDVNGIRVNSTTPEMIKEIEEAVKDLELSKGISFEEL